MAYYSEANCSISDDLMVNYIHLNRLASEFKLEELKTNHTQELEELKTNHVQELSQLQTKVSSLEAAIDDLKASVSLARGG